MELRSLIQFLRRWLWLLVAGLVLAGGTAYVVSGATAGDPTYRSSATVLVGPALAVADANPSQLDASRRVASIYVQVATSRPLLERVADEVNLEIAPEVLRLQVTATTPQDPPLIFVTAVANDSQAAAAIANEVVDQLIAISPALVSEDETNDFLLAQVEALEDEIAELVAAVDRLSAVTNRTDEQEDALQALRDRLAAQRSTYAALVGAATPSASTLLTVIEPAIPSTIPVPGNRAQLTIFAAVLGLVVAIGVALLMEYLDDTVKTDDDVATAAEGIPNLASIYSIPGNLRRNPDRLHVNLGLRSPVGESFRSLRTNIELTAPKAVHSLLVTSALRDEGKTTVAANLAVAFAQAGREVLLVDANLRQPDLHRHFGLNNTHGLSDLLQSADLDIGEVVRPTGVARLRLLPAGVPPADAAAVASSPKMKETIQRLRRHADLLIVDSPAMLAATEAALLASCTEWTLIVVAAGRTSVSALRDLSRSLERAKAKVIGATLNRMPASWRAGRWIPYPGPEARGGKEPTLNEETGA